MIQIIAETGLALHNNRDLMIRPLINNVRFNRYDQKYMESLSTYGVNNKALSEKQNALFEKMIHKYRKQIKKLGVSYNDILALEWKLPLITKEELNQKTYFKLIEDGSMEMYFNFNKKMIEEVRTLIHDDAGRYLKKNNDFNNAPKYDFNWNNSAKIWHGDFNVHLFRDLYYYSRKHDIQVDKTITDVFDYFEKTCGHKEYYEPRIRVSHKRMYICGIAETMLPFLEDIDMTDYSVQNVEKIVKLGVLGPNEHAIIDEYVSAKPKAQHDIKDELDVSVLIAYIKASKRKFVLYARPDTVFNDPNSNETTKKLTKEYSKLTALPNVALYNPGNEDPTEYIDRLVEKGYNTLLTTQALDNLLRNQKVVGKFGLQADKVVHISLAGKT